MLLPMSYDEAATPAFRMPRNAIGQEWFGREK
jgi:hypothetical protein